MFRFDPALKVYLHREPVDGRKAINGLALLVEQVEQIFHGINLLKLTGLPARC